MINYTQPLPSSRPAHLSRLLLKLNCSRNWDFFYVRCLKAISHYPIAEYSVGTRNLMTLGLVKDLRPSGYPYPFLTYRVRKAKGSKEWPCHCLQWHNPLIFGIYTPGHPSAEEAKVWWGWGGRQQRYEQQTLLQPTKQPLHPSQRQGASPLPLKAYSRHSKSL